MAIEDCVTDGAGRGEVTEATNLFVISRMRLGQEGTAGYVRAQQWKDADMPELEQNIHVYGIAELNIRQESETVFLVEYEKWEQPTEETVSRLIYRARSVAYTRRDRLYLIEDGKYWAINRIDRLKDEPIPGSSISG